MTEKKNIRAVIEPNETEQMALDRVKKQLKLTDEELQSYEIIFYKETPIKRTFKNLF